MTIIKKEQHQQQEIKLNSSSNQETVKYDTNLCRNRCIICYKLLKNWKGATLTPHYDIDKLIGVSSKSSLCLNSIEEDEDETENEDNNGDVINNKNNCDQTATLVNNNSNSNKSNCGETTRAKKSTIGELIKKSLIVNSKEKSLTKQATPANSLNYLQQILKANSEIGGASSSKKLCKTCYDYIVLIDYHMNLADNLRSLMKNKLFKSFQLINTNRLIKNNSNSSSKLDLNRIKLFSLNNKIKKRKLRLIKAKKLTKLSLNLHNGVYLANGSTNRSVLSKTNSLVGLKAVEVSAFNSGNGLKRKVNNNEPAVSKTSGNLIGEDYGELVNEIKIARLAKQESSKNGRVISTNIGPKFNQNSMNSSNGLVNSIDNQHQSPFRSSSNAAHIHQNRNITSVSSKNQIQVCFVFFLTFNFFLIIF